MKNFMKNRSYKQNLQGFNHENQAAADAAEADL